MKEIERPDIERAAGEVHAGRCFGFDDHKRELTRFNEIFSRASLTNSRHKLKSGLLPMLRKATSQKEEMTANETEEATKVVAPAHREETETVILQPCGIAAWSHQ